jgi:hypothetical protein
MDEFDSSAPLYGDEFEDWSDIDTSNLTDEDEESESAPETEEQPADEADQPETEEEPEEKGEEEPETEEHEEEKAEEKPSDQTFELKHLDETKTVSREEVIALAQKGLDYDRIRGKLDELRGVEAQAGENEMYAAFVKELADGAGISIEELIDGTRARILTDRANRDGKPISKEEAMKQAKQTREAYTQSAQQGKEVREQRLKQEKFREEAGRFRELYPDIKAEDIPAEVWQDYDRTGNLVDAWNKSENQRLKNELESLRTEYENFKQDTKNEQRSTGSRKSAGASQRTAVDDEWEAALNSEW